MEKFAKEYSTRFFKEDSAKITNEFWWEKCEQKSHICNNLQSTVISPYLNVGDFHDFSIHDQKKHDDTLLVTPIFDNT